MAFPFQICTTTTRRLRVNATTPLLDDNQERTGGARGSAGGKKDCERTSADSRRSITATTLDTCMGAMAGDDGSGARPAPSEQKAQCGRRFFCAGCCSAPPAAIHVIPVDVQISISKPLSPGLACASRGHSALSAMASMASQEPNRRVDCLSSIGPALYHNEHRRCKVAHLAWRSPRAPGANRPASADRRRCSATTDCPIKAPDPAPRHRAGVVLGCPNRTRVQCAHAFSRYCFDQ